MPTHDKLLDPNLVIMQLKNYPKIDAHESKK